MDKQRRVKALGYGEQRIEALGQTPYIDFDLKDGTSIRLPHPLRLDDEALTRFEAFQRGDELDREPVLNSDGQPRVDPQTGKPATQVITPPHIDGKLAPPYAVRLMKAILGDGDYQKLIDHGLRAAELSEIWQDLSRSREPESEDDADPKGKQS